MQARLARLESKLGYSFKDIGLLERALTHRSWAFENLPGASEDEVRARENESMEFLGDSVLGLAIAEQLYTSRVNATEGDLTLMKHHLVSTVTLAVVAERLKLGDFVRFGRGEEKTGGRKKQALLANTLEAVIAAVFLDGGYIPARHFISTLFAKELKAATPKASLDQKTTLQELIQSNGDAAPRYNLVSTDGPPHLRIFNVRVEWSGGAADGEGSSIKSAEMMAASEALKMLVPGKKQKLEK
ncbi:MAG: ribonuclease III [Pyrinomonadaceae bacterium]|nr:ribonuclease III [Pyrinomonadaceae bacterium]